MKKILFIIFAIIISVTVGAQNLVWDGTAEPWTHGSGTEEDPYLIETPQNLAYLAEIVNGEPYWNWDWDHRFADTCFLLTSDIDLGGGNGLVWNPIGTRLHSYSNVVRFSGHFDGGGHVISNMRITNDSTYQHDYYGLFGFAGGGSIKNVVLDNTCSVNINDSYDYGSNSIGSIVAIGNQIVISGCNSAATIECRGLMGEMFGTRIGGICGYLNESSVEKCHFSGSVFCDAYSMYSYVSAGGVIGTISDSCNVIDCHNYGDIINNPTYCVGDALTAGGVAGVAIKHNTITHCSNAGNVSLDADAYNDGNKILNSSGGILGGAWSNTYGLIATAEVEIIDCDNNADISADAIDETEMYASGIVGEIGVLAKVNVRNCYHVGNLEADLTGGIMVPEGDSVSVVNSYFIDNCGGDNGFGEPKTDDFMKSEAFVNLLNADSVVFAMDTFNANGGYPIFANGIHYDVAENKSVDTEISCYPNPVSDKLNIETSSDLEISNVSLYDISGRLIKMQATDFESVDISNFATGVYVMKITLGNGKVFEEKIVKR